MNTYILIATIIGTSLIIFLNINNYIKKNLINTKKQKTREEELQEKREKLQKYYDLDKEQEETISQKESLHVKQKTRPSYQENKKRGNDYEEHVGKYYERIGYSVIYNGLTKGRKDGGIDLIAKNDFETLLIQCKAWQKAEIKQKHLKEFIGNCTTFLEDNEMDGKIKRVFITSSENHEKGLEKYLKQHVGKIEFIIIPF